MRRFARMPIACRTSVSALLGVIFSLSQPAAPAAAQNMLSPSMKARVDQWVALIDPHSNPTLSEYAAFLSKRPFWPRRPILLGRFQAKLSVTNRSDDLSRYCPLFPLSDVQALNRCGPYLADTHDQAIRIWESGREREGEETMLLNLVGSIPDQTAQVRRFHALMSRSHYVAARRQIARLSGVNRRAAPVELAFATRDATAETQFDALPPALQHRSRVLLPYLRWLRLAGRQDEAVRLWKSVAFTVQAAHPSHGWMQERLRLAYDLLAAHDVPSALAMVRAPRPGGATSANLDAHFLAGWMALKQTHEYVQAEHEFALLSRQTNIIQRARGNYWMAQARLAQGDVVVGTQMLHKAAHFPTTYYGQLAIAALDHREGYFRLMKTSFPGLRKALKSLPPVAATPPSRPDLILAARYLASEGRIDDADVFLLAAWVNAESPAEMAAIARTAIRMKIYRPAVFAARRAGAQGVALYPEGWQHPVISVPPGAFPVALSWAVARQESSFDADIVSPAQAVGLMQLLPGTARDMAHQVGVPNARKLTTEALKNPKLNMQLGTAYLSYLLGQLQEMPPIVLAAYNAGPTRAKRWLQARMITPESPNADVIDWVENVPFAETRAYIQRVMENFKILEVEAENGQ
ncbi:transglycosylase SLT domain-containing protein [Sorlinia euscelidii]|uniref:Transglycosylase SLT domain-containing protein n=2 Tax=Sorlinia euscelidii TaxID=3081148 RepID=A0ABU7U242_9PROT